MVRQKPYQLHTLTGCAKCGLGYPVSEMWLVDDDTYLCAKCHRETIMNENRNKRRTKR